MSRDREALWAAIITALPEGRDNAISVKALAVEVWMPGGQSSLRPSTVRAHIVRMQEAGFGILTSPRAGVWIAADDDERLDVLEELRETVSAIERRMQLINGGKCALRSCRAELSEKIKRRGGLYCKPQHRFTAAAERGSS